jgi:hypothetical protein
MILFHLVFTYIGHQELEEWIAVTRTVIGRFNENRKSLASIAEYNVHLCSLSLSLNVGVLIFYSPFCSEHNQTLPKDG